MNDNKYAMYAVAIGVGGAVALWAGLPPFFLLLLACPLMMFFMMRGGMHGSHGESDSSRGGQQGSTPARPADLDGSHERIGHP